jgi:hypothetical protein
VVRRRSFWPIPSSPLVGALLGALFFFCIFGFKLLKPSYIEWQLDRDAAQHYLGWEFFRYEPWRFPPGMIAGYGTPDGSSITYTDSIPVMALLSKLLRSLLPEPFQYTGLWMLLCYVLQGFFGWLLASLATRSGGARTLMTVLFIVSPALLNRAVGHHALMAHWLLLGAIYMGLQRRQLFEQRHPRLSHMGCWTALIVLAALVHLYLLAMVVVMYAASVISDFFGHRTRNWTRYVTPIVPLTLGWVALYVAGAFVVGAKDWGTHAAVFGAFSMNLLAPVVPGCMGSPSETAYLSYFLTPTQFATRAMGLFEGFNYLGLGVLALVCIVSAGGIASAVVHLKRDTRVKRRRVIGCAVPLPLVVVALSMGLYSLSNVIMFGTHRLVVVPLGVAASQFCGIFRASGRFFWPLGYLLLWMTLRALGRYIARFGTIGTGLLGVIVALQVSDLSRFFARFASHNRTVAHYTSPLRSAFWNDAMKRYRQILYYPPSDTAYYVPLGLLAAPRGVGLNVSYKARSNSALAAEAERALVMDLESGNLRPLTLYVFNDKSMYEALQRRPSRSGIMLKQVDGLYVAGRVRIDD